jgi:primosomal protein N' (replication factor Y) (superfamily II helicase)
MILQIAIPKPVYTHFDYLPPPGIEMSRLQPGIRLRVPFGKNQSEIGILLAIAENSAIASHKLKFAEVILDNVPILPPDILQLLQWASDYYHHPLGEVISTALPTLLNQGHPAIIQTIQGWKLTASGQEQLASLAKTAHRQQAVLQLLQEHPNGLSHVTLSNSLSNIVPVLRTLEKKNWITPHRVEPTHLVKAVESISLPLPLNTAQTQAVNRVCQHLKRFYPCLLDGVTGSGKTEVYLQIIQQVLNQNRQALVLIPEINLTPQMVNRFQQRFSVPLAIFHSKLTPHERLQAWLLAKEGIAPIVIGTRSAVWTPLARPGLFIVDEEHDPAYKQQDGFRYSARDMAVVRAQRAQVPILLGSATPSLDSLYNAQQQRYQHLILPERAGTAVHPRFQVVDMRPQSRQSLSWQLVQAITLRLAKQQQVLLFINRRGYAPTLMCYHCGWVAYCQHCDAPLTYHQTNQNLCCHYCGATRLRDTRCPDCHQEQLFLLGQGTQRIEEQLQQQFSQARILRIDSDSTRGKNAMHTLLEHIHGGEVDILVGTQMLAKGHHFPKVTLVGVINIDSGLYNADFRAPERMAQLLVQVAGRAGRAEEPGEVIIQTYHPDHPLLNCLIREGYLAFAQVALQERQLAQFPPYTRLALLRAEANQVDPPLQFLQAAKEQALQLTTQEIQLWGPVPAPMARRAGWYRAQLLLQATQREVLHQLLSQWLPCLASLAGRKVRWSLDIDPQELL